VPETVGISVVQVVVPARGGEGDDVGDAGLDGRHKGLPGAVLVVDVEQYDTPVPVEAALHVRPPMLRPWDTHGRDAQRGKRHHVQLALCEADEVPGVVQGREVEQSAAPAFLLRVLRLELTDKGVGAELRPHGLFVDVQVRDADPAGESLEPFEGTGGVYEPYAVSLCGAGQDAPAVHVLFGGGALVGGLEFVDGPHECCLLPSVLWP